MFGLNQEVLKGKKTMDKIYSEITFLYIFQEYESVLFSIDFSKQTSTGKTKKCIKKSED